MPERQPGFTLFRILPGKNLPTFCHRSIRGVVFFRTSAIATITPTKCKIEYSAFQEPCHEIYFKSGDPFKPGPPLGINRKR